MRHDTARRRTAEHWSHYEPRLEQTYFGFPPLRPYLIRTGFGVAAAEAHADNRWWAEDIVAERYLTGRPPSSILSLCCGFGAVEQHLLPLLPSVTTCTAIDIAPLAVTEARRRAEAQGLGEVIHYEIADLTEYPWRSEAFDLVLANGALHHLTNVEAVLDGVHATLTPGGILYANEHIGARHQGFGLRQLELINAAAYIVPPHLRMRHPRRCNPLTSQRGRRLADLLLGNADLERLRMAAQQGSLERAAVWMLRHLTLPPRSDFGALVSPRAADIIARDPSEGVSSDRILAAVEERFEGARVHDYGGALLAYALDQAFFERFDGDSPRDTEVLEDAVLT